METYYGHSYSETCLQIRMRISNEFIVVSNAVTLFKVKLTTGSQIPNSTIYRLVQLTFTLPCERSYPKYSNYLTYLAIFAGKPSPAFTCESVLSINAKTTTHTRLRRTLITIYWKSGKYTFWINFVLNSCWLDIFLKVVLIMIPIM